MASMAAIPGVLKNQMFKRGQLIVSASPYAHVISMRHNGSYCDFCCLPPSNEGRLQRCSACKYENYCGKTCQRNAWKYHKFECPLLKKVSPKVPSDSVRLLAKLVWNCANDVDCPDNDPGWRVFTDLCHHTSSSEFKADVLRQKQFMEISYTLKNYLGSQSTCLPIEPNELLPTFGRMLYNGFTLVHQGIEVGAAVYVSPSVFDHSCVPNAVFVNNGSTVAVHALRDIDTSKESILVNYVDPLQPKAVRQKELLKDYLFVCHCLKCDNTDASEILFDSFLCPHCQGNAVKRADERDYCLDCQQEIDDPIYMQKVYEYISKCEALETKVLRSDYCTKDELVDLLSENKYLAPINVHLSLLKVNLYAEESRYGTPTKAYNLGEEVTQIFNRHYPPYFTMHGEHQLKQARLAWQLDDYKNARQHYGQALLFLEVSHGKEHHLYKTVLEDQAECRRDQFFFEKAAVGGL